MPGSEPAAITGIGVIGAPAVGREPFWESCRRAVSAIGLIEEFDTTALRTNVAAQVRGFDPRQFMPPRSYRRMSRISRMAVAASIEALADSHLNLPTLDRRRVGVVLGTAHGSSSHVEHFFAGLLAEGPRGTQPLYFPETVPNAPASHIAMFHGLTGPNCTFCQNMISAENALLYGWELLCRDQADVVLAGGAEEISAMQFRCYDDLRTLNPVRVEAGQSIRPLPGRGFVLGEGAAVLVMEKTQTAIARGADIYGQLRAGAIAAGPAAMGHYEPDGRAIGRAVARALQEACLPVEEIDQLNVSANYAAGLDAVEAEQLSRRFDPHGRGLGLSPLKYLMGDFGAAGAHRAAATLLSLRRGQPLPTIEAAELAAGLPHGLRWRQPPPRTLSNALMTSTTHGGGSCSLVFTTHH
jgi:3-oxoacyl-[acyl-carrier-protein] synthase II